MDKNTSNNVPDGTQGDLPVNTPPNVGNPPSQGDQGTPTIEALQQKLAELERDNRKYRNERKQQEEAAQLAEQERLKQQGEYKELAERHQARVQELEPIAVRYNQLSSVITEQIAVQTKDWPKEVKDLLPTSDDEPDVAKRLQHVQRLQLLVSKMTEHARGSQPGNSPNPTPTTGEKSREQQITDFKQRARSSGKYGL